MDELSDGCVSELDDVLGNLAQIEKRCLESNDPNGARFKKAYDDAKKKLFETLTAHEALLVLASCKNACGDWTRRLLDDGDNHVEELFSAGLRY